MGLAFDGEIDFPQEPSRGFTHPLDEVADRVLAALQQPDDVAHGQRALPGDRFHLTEILGDFLRTVEADEVLAGAAGDEGNAAEVAADVVVEVGGDPFADLVELVLRHQAPALDDEDGDEEGSDSDDYD